MTTKALIWLLIRLCLLITLVGLGVVLIYNNVGLGVVLCFVVVVLVGFSIVKSFRAVMYKVGFMFNSIENDDFTFRFTTADQKTAQQKYFNQALNRIKNLVLDARDVARKREKYFELILDQVNTGIVIFNDQGVVFQINSACLRLFGVNHLTHIRQLDGVHSALEKDLSDIVAGQTRVVKFYDEVAQVSLSMTCAKIETYQQDAKVVTVTDIAGELNNTEMDSWQRLSRVLTHEIMNSLAPITSLSDTLLQTKDEATINKGLAIINETAKRLTNFVENYRKLTKIPQPVMCLIDMGELVKKEIDLCNFNVEIVLKTHGCVIEADKALVSQVVVNLMKNAIEAANGCRVWVVLGRKENGNFYIDVCNEGQAISDELRENIFIPFFTTKENGSGVGLSLSRQIMRKHNGMLTLSTKPHTTFRMQF